MADSNTLFLLVSYTMFVSVLQNILFTDATILILEFVHFWTKSPPCGDSLPSFLAT